MPIQETTLSHSIPVWNLRRLHKPIISITVTENCILRNMYCETKDTYW